MNLNQALALCWSDTAPCACVSVRANVSVLFCLKIRSNRQQKDEKKKYKKLKIDHHHNNRHQHTFITLLLLLVLNALHTKQQIVVKANFCFFSSFFLWIFFSVFSCAKGTREKRRLKALSLNRFSAFIVCFYPFFLRVFWWKFDFSCFLLLLFLLFQWFFVFPACECNFNFFLIIFIFFLLFLSVKNCVCLELWWFKTNLINKKN